MSGVACRYKLLDDGSRPIIALLLPGDFCDLQVAILGEMDHGIATITSCTMVEIPPKTILELTGQHSRIAHALWWATLVDEGVLREWLANTGGREATTRMAHLFCEILVRLQSVGLADANGCALHLTQTELGNILAVTPVHVSRTLRSLREQQLLEFEGGRLYVPDLEALKTFAGFRPNYLHLGR
jgi:CRP-like cAMP-binding protein